jgi:hypothetical protein
MWRAILGQNVYIDIGSAACEACNATRNFGTNSAFVLGPRKTLIDLTGCRIFQRQTDFK